MSGPEVSYTPPDASTQAGQQAGDAVVQILNKPTLRPTEVAVNILTDTAGPALGGIPTPGGLNPTDFQMNNGSQSEFQHFFGIDPVANETRDISREENTIHRDIDEFKKYGPEVVDNAPAKEYHQPSPNPVHEGMIAARLAGHSWQDIGNYLSNAWRTLTTPLPPVAPPAPVNPPAAPAGNGNPSARALDDFLSGPRPIPSGPL